ncbi:MAG: mannose-6-phosphate isomerase, class I [Treponema sp.]|jgi:mannose-6-phosphate isomerase|nr:mannose-6-phosphate isomerase, class I [Treponema sp.]
MAKNDLRIDTLGTSITIAADESPEYLQKILSKYYEAVEKVRGVSGLTDPLKIAILTGFLLCDDLEKAGNPDVKTGESENLELQRITLGMISLLDNALLPQAPLQTPVQEETEFPQTPPAGKNTPRFYELLNTVKNYEWGSTEWLAALMGQKNVSKVPQAELWMGVHQSSPSRLLMPNGEEVSLQELIDSDREKFLGSEVSQNFGKLPFLFKVLAAAKPLSIQAHPNKKQAEEGFMDENLIGIPLDDRMRNYHDSNHKPEIICALSPFASLCGFRQIDEIKNFLDILIKTARSQTHLQEEFERLYKALQQQDENPYKAFLSSLLAMKAETVKDVTSLIRSTQQELINEYGQYNTEWNLCAYFSKLHPHDPAILSPFYLNVIELNPGQAMYLPAGVLHSYIHGLGIELMADSDNVLRGGLTPKHVDTFELLRILDFCAFTPEIISAPNPLPALFTYDRKAEEFALSVLHGECADIPYTVFGPSIVIITEGSAKIASPEGGQLLLHSGQSVFIPANEKPEITFSGTFTAYAAGAPSKTNHGKEEYAHTG